MRMLLFSQILVRAGYFDCNKRTVGLPRGCWQHAGGVKFSARTILMGLKCKSRRSLRAAPAHPWQWWPICWPPGTMVRALPGIFDC